jgi:hypothetical protein
MFIFCYAYKEKAMGVNGIKMAAQKPAGRCEYSTGCGGFQPPSSAVNPEASLRFAQPRLVTIEVVF